jgi:hypothetical protein
VTIDEAGIEHQLVTVDHLRVEGRLDLADGLDAAVADDERALVDRVAGSHDDARVLDRVAFARVGAGGRPADQREHGGREPDP